MYGDNECDTNADTCCLGTNFIVLSYTSRTADVYPYDKSYQPITNVPIVSGATAYDDIKTGTTYVLVINEGLYYGPKLGHSLINPNQIRQNGIHFWDNPYDTSHDLSIETDIVTVPLYTKGTKVYFKTRTPTKHELERCLRVHLTSTHFWEPTELMLGEVTHEENYKSKWAHFFSDDSYMQQISSSLNGMKELMISQIRTLSLIHI